MMWGWDDGWGWGMGWMMLFGWLGPLLLLGLVVYAVLQAVERGRSGATYPPPLPPAPPLVPPLVPRREETPLEVAQRRYAAGELSREEFVRIRDDIAGSVGGMVAPPG